MRIARALVPAFVLVAGGVLAGPLVQPLVQPLSLQRLGDLCFGQVVAGPGPGAVVLGLTGIRSAHGGATLGNGTRARPAQIAIAGQPSKAFAVTLPDSATLTDGESAMEIDHFTSTPNGAGVLDHAGTQVITIGASLHLHGAQPAGNYSGAFTILVSYY